MSQDGSTQQEVYNMKFKVYSSTIKEFTDCKKDLQLNVANKTEQNKLISNLASE